MSKPPPSIHRETDSALINRIANSDAVRPFIHPDGAEMDFGAACEGDTAQDNIYFLSNGDDAVAIFVLTAPRIWQSHTMFADTCRGRRAVETGRAMVAYMFDRDLADVLWGTTARPNRAARWFNRQIGAAVVDSDDEEEVFEIIRFVSKTHSAHRM